jgi:hypothetical protein
MRRPPFAALTVLLGLALLAPGGRADAQIVGLPLLQSPFTAPQLAVGLNASFGDSLTVTGLAGGWTPRSGRVQVIGGVARVARDEVDAGYAAGARFYLPLKLLVGESVALGVLAGAGAERGEGVTPVTAPGGVTVGYPRARGATRAVAVYATPFFSYTSVRRPQAASSVFRYAVGADVVLIRRVGLTVGYEGGGEPAAGEPGVRSSVSGVGLSYAF